jgi:hypothetical protein
MYAHLLKEVCARFPLNIHIDFVAKGEKDDSNDDEVQPLVLEHIDKSPQFARQLASSSPSWPAAVNQKAWSLRFYLLLFALELAPSKNSPIFCSGTFHLYLTEFLS